MVYGSHFLSCSNALYLIVPLGSSIEFCVQRLTTRTFYFLGCMLFKCLLITLCKPVLLLWKATTAVAVPKMMHNKQVLNSCFFLPTSNYSKLLQKLGRSFCRTFLSTSKCTRIECHWPNQLTMNACPRNH